MLSGDAIRSDQGSDARVNVNSKYMRDFTTEGWKRKESKNRWIGAGGPCRVLVMELNAARPIDVCEQKR